MKKTRYVRFLLSLVSVCFVALEAKSLPLQSYLRKPKLVVVLIIDQMRADYLTRFESRFLPARSANGAVGGFKYLMANGAYFPFARYNVLQCMTAPGHAMILTGSYPYQNGISMNNLYNPQRKGVFYVLEDAGAPIVGAETEQPGMSPRGLIGTTVGDELKNAGYASRVVGVALKDRGAILPTGHRADLAMWFDSATFRWVSSRFYWKDGKIPGWVDAMNAALAKRKGTEYVWAPKDKPTGLSSPDATGSFERKMVVGSKETLLFPLAAEMTIEAALQALSAFEMGKDATPDLLSVSFSAHDMVGHKFGPNSREMEETTVAEDRAIAALLNGVRTRVPGGLKDVVFVLTADHGVAPTLAYAQEAGLDAGILSSEALAEKGEKAIVAKFGAPPSGKWITGWESFNFYLNQEALTARKLLSSEVEAEFKKAILTETGVAFVFTRSEYFERHLPPGQIERRILNTYLPNRNGQVVVIPRPYFGKDASSAAHVTGYSYDSNVPLIISGPNVHSGVFAQATDIVDLAPTLAFLLGVLPPALSEGRILSEVLTSSRETRAQ